MTTRSALAVLLLLALLSMRVGCAARGSAFAAVDEIPSGTALVYIYRSGSFRELTAGGAIRYHVMDGDHRVVFLIRGGYFPYFAEPGVRTFWARTESKSEATRDLYPGETYYLRGTIVSGVGVGRPSLEFVDAETGHDELQDLKLLPPAEN